MREDPLTLFCTLYILRIYGANFVNLTPVEYHGGRNYNHTREIETTHAIPTQSISTLPTHIHASTNAFHPTSSPIAFPPHISTPSIPLRGRAFPPALAGDVHRLRGRPRPSLFPTLSGDNNPSHCRRAYPSDSARLWGGPIAASLVPPSWSFLPSVAGRGRREPPIWSPPGLVPTPTPSGFLHDRSPPMGAVGRRTTSRYAFRGVTMRRV